MKKERLITHPSPLLRREGTLKVNYLCTEQDALFVRVEFDQHNNINSKKKFHFVLYPLFKNSNMI